ncbi:hypothetical protein CEUSTIGMA_g10007.t1 [Chlamydomonas eustigma]|uniref:GPN-loop GTPase 2 n=1 Tax=Chlamydomonas eustigma TaxID=1157962 RepID=A0A250XHN2_9CHLO|nr:hypothetical protein CEUSTIGMA_g10007.t1 [Chlamydomonas eustigma]|eukprot:GAX82581.1 hypothetical protein CEUSTIGMA_g10007.t1 [Chlamydomonas eustigma]
MPFGQLVIGPPGSGKTTYCHGLLQYCQTINRKIALVNLDPANDNLPYKPAVDISDLVHLPTVMDELKLGPNGGLIYCIDYLEKNMDWLQEKLEPLEKENYFIVMDLPGQVELFMMHDSLKKILSVFADKWNYRLTAIQLVDGHLCTDPSKFISMLVLSLNTMLHLEMPHINVLSKVDLIRQYGKLDFNLDFYTEVQDLSYLTHRMGFGPFSKRYRKLSEGLCRVVEDFGLVKYVPLAIQDKESLAFILGLSDKANGYVFAKLAEGSPVPPEYLYGSTVKGDESDLWMDYQEKYVDKEVRERKPTEQSHESIS